MTPPQKHLHEKLWAAAEHLRANGSLKLNEISEPILGLIFLKFADVRFQRAKVEIEKRRSTMIDVPHSRSQPVTSDHYKAHGVLYIPEKATYTHLMNLSESENIGKAINEAMKMIEMENRELAGVLPQDYTSISKKTDENSKILITLLKNFNQIPDDIDYDAFGSIYEYFLGEFARSEGQGGGEFFTPQPIVKLLVEVLEPNKGRLYDPACGSGGMFVQSAKFVEQHAKKEHEIQEITICGQEKGETNVRIAKMNLAIHGLSAKIALANSFYEDAHDSIGRFDFVLANPPFNVKGKDKNGQLIIDPARIKGDPRYNLGLPVTQKGEITNANYLWIQMFASALSPQGRAGFVMANSASDARNEEKKIRQQLIESGIVDVIVSVGTNMFLNATLSCTLWFFDKRKVGTPRQNKILFINAQDLYTQVDRAHNTWTDAQISGLSGIVRRYREEEGYEKYDDIKGRCRVVTLDAIRDNKYSLNPGNYIEIIEKEVSGVDFDARMKELMNEFTSLTRDAHMLEAKIQEDWKSIL